MTRPNTREMPDKALLAKYERQNAECRNRLYADYTADRPTHMHPLTLVVLGAVLGAIVTAAILLLRRRSE